MRRSLLVVVLALSLTGGAVGVAEAKIPKRDQRAFVKGCIDGGGTKQQCQCTIRKIEKRYTYEEFLEMAERVSRTGKFDKKMKRILRACA